MVADLEGKLKTEAKALIGNRGYRRYLKTESEGFRIDADKVRAEEKYDGVRFLQKARPRNPGVPVSASKTAPARIIGGAWNSQASNSTASRSTRGTPKSCS